MEKSLKDQNRLILAVVVLVNAAIYLAALGGDWTIAGWAGELADLQRLIPAPLVTVFVGVLNAQIDHNNKARLVFWRWTHPLPGSRAFTKYMHKDDRVDADALRQHEDPLPTDPGQQNKLWYRWYREVENDPRIRQVHRQYLFSRDYAGIAILLACSLGPLSVWQLGSGTTAGVYSVALVGQYFVARRAAYNHGVRFVTSVLATKAGVPRTTVGG